MEADWRRGESRFGPIQSVDAVLKGSESTLARGVLVNLSESGARLINNVGVTSGRLVHLQLRSSRDVVLNTRAMTVWNSVGIESSVNLVGFRQGIQFIFSSESERHQIKQLLIRYHETSQQRARRMRFDVLDDPDLEELFTEQASYPSDPIENLRLLLQPDLENFVRKITSS